MKTALLGLLLFTTAFAKSKQRAETFQAAVKSGLTVELLDRQYTNALDNNDKKSVFKGNRQKKFVEAYEAMLTDINVYLHKNKFNWEKPARIVHRIYFEPDGTIDHYLLNLDAAGMDKTKQDRFIILLNQFIANYKIKITAGEKFAQCGPAIYQD